MRRALVVLIGCLLALTTACGTGSVSGDELEKQVSAQLTKAVGQKPDKVSCPDDLKGEKGAKTRCTLTAQGQKYGVTVTTTSVDGNKVNFSIKVDDKPMS